MARRSRQTPPAVAPDDFGGAPVMAEPPPAPARGPAPIVEVDFEPASALVDLGEPPTDGLELQAYMHRAIAVAARDAMLDRKLSPSERRREVRQLALASRALVPETKLWEAVELIKGDRADLERKKQRPKLTSVPKAVGEDPR